jgi:tetraacyldisaccharide 4'-kinase
MSTAFRFIVEARQKLYDTGVLPTVRLNHPVISVGNLTVGGTGKTPLVIALVERLRDEGYRPVVLSRGYKRVGSGVVIVSRGNGPLVKPLTAGDEPLLIARRTKGIPVVVGADRHEAGLVAERENLGDIFVLDDGFQHRRLHRDVDLVTVDPVEWEAGERLLPAGPWREPKSAILRAQAACVRTEGNRALPSLPIPVFAMETVIDGIYDGDRQVPIESIRGHAIVAFAGIAKPERFFDALENLGIFPVRRVRFRDHHRYSERDLQRLGGETWITTEKDAVRLEGRGFKGFMTLRISARIPQLDALLDLIRGHLHARQA